MKEVYGVLILFVVVVSGGYVAPGLYHDPSYYAPKPYDFGYDVQDSYGNQQFRKETSDGKGRVVGSYGYTDAYGIYRIVEYVADEFGYRAKVKTNEPGTANQNPAHVTVRSQAIPHVTHYKKPIYY
ncbi:cuticle protein 10.9-like [Centruroides vittatus]|uniref:cuticle protein 10.9-like n=1 Tax=Centruroides vittatus TaxID=120091 RepID=UPI00350E944E